MIGTSLPSTSSTPASTSSSQSGAALISATAGVPNDLQCDAALTASEPLFTTALSAACAARLPASLAVAALVAPNRDGTLIDATYGRGGHTRGMLQALSPKGAMHVFDMDTEAIDSARQLAASDGRVRPHHAPFSSMAELLLPGTLAIVTDAFGIFVIGVSSIALMKKVAIFGAFWALSIAVTEMLLNRLMIAYFPAPSSFQHYTPGPVKRFLKKTADVATGERSSRVVLAIWLVVVVISGWAGLWVGRVQLFPCH